MKNIRIWVSASLGLLACYSVASADMTVMTFDTVPAQTLANDAVYTEVGMMATSVGEMTWSIGDNVGQSGYAGNGTNGLYFHGMNAYVEIKRIDGSTFDLSSLDLLTNGFTDRRWLETSSGATVFLAGYTTITTIPFSGPDYTGIEWFRVGTPWFATQIDNVCVSAVPVPAAVLLGMLGLGAAGMKLRRFV